MSVDLLTGVVACVGMMLHSIVYMTSKRSHPLFRVLAGLAVFGWFANAAFLLARLP